MDLQLQHLLASLNSTVVSQSNGRKLTRYRLLRHSFKSDAAIARQLDPEVDTEKFAIFPPTAEDKIAALRTTLRLLQAFCAEMGKDRYKYGDGLVDIVLAFAKADGVTAEFLGAFEVIGRMGLADFLTE